MTQEKNQNPEQIARDKIDKMLMEMSAFDLMSRGRLNSPYQDDTTHLNKRINK